MAQNPALLTAGGLQKADLKSLEIHLEATYLIRLFAEFETGIKNYWKAGLNKKTRPGVYDLLESLASRHRVLDAVRINAHAVRKYRNKLVHEEDAEAEYVSIKQSRAFLCRFFAYLPHDW